MHGGGDIVVRFKAARADGRTQGAEQICRLLQAEPDVLTAEERAAARVDDHSLWRASAAYGRPKRASGEAGNGWQAMGKCLPNPLPDKPIIGTGTGHAAFAVSPDVQKDAQLAAILHELSEVRESRHVSGDEFQYAWYCYGLEHYGGMPLIEPAEGAEERRLREEKERIAKEEAERIAALNRQNNNKGSSSNSSGATNTGGWLYPLPYQCQVTDSYGYRIHPLTKKYSWHNGVDFGAAAGTAILAAKSGTVTTAAYSGAWGYYVVINHGDGYSTLYAHQPSLSVSVGDYVTQGQTIGYVGSTGYSTGPHLHFTIYYNGSDVNPFNYIG